MSGVGRPWHWLGTVVAKFFGYLVVKSSSPEDMEYLEVGKTYEFDVSPIGSDSSGETGSGSQSGS